MQRNVIGSSDLGIGIAAVESSTSLAQITKVLLDLPAAQIDAWAWQNGGLDQLTTLGRSLGDAASRGSRAALAEIHEALSGLYEHTFVIPRNSVDSAHGSAALRLVQALLERAAIQHCTAVMPTWTLPGWSSGEQFVERMLERTREHPAFDHPYYARTLRDEGDVDDLRFYFAQESTVDPRFDDLVAMLQIGTRGAAKRELANNYADEMGNGNPDDVHSELFAKALTALGLGDQPLKGTKLSTESQICGNLSALLASRREHFYRGAGYFGVMEFLVPRRMEHVLHSWERNGLPSDAVQYQQVHMTVDAAHSDGWFHNVVAPAVNADRECAAEILEGVVWRLETSQWYLDMLEAHARGRTA